MANKDVKFNDDGLQNLISALKKDYFVRIGIIGSKATKVHANSKITNAQLGAHHEFGGTSKHGKEQPPRRSFLEDSLKFKLKFNDSKLEDLRKSFFKNFFVKKAPQQFMQDLGEKAFRIVQLGFATNGFGMWKPLAMKTFAERYEKARMNYIRTEREVMRGKHGLAGLDMLKDYIGQMQNQRILHDTGEMQNSISFKVMRRK